MKGEAMNVWKEYRVKLQFTNELMGGTPKNPELIRDWLEAKGAPDIEANAQEIEASIEASEQRSWCGFQSQDGQGLCMRGYHVKAHIKDCANILKDMLGIKALRSKVADRCYVMEDYIPLAAKEPSGFFEHPVRVMTAQGPRSALKRTDYVNKPLITFRLRMLAVEIIPKTPNGDLLDTIFEYGGIHGMGSDRGMGFGRYKVEEITEMV